jgi:hypothetical protein
LVFRVEGAYEVISMPTEKDDVSLDPTQLLGFRDISKVGGAVETPTMEGLSRVLSKAGEEIPPPKEKTCRPAAQPE